MSRDAGILLTVPEVHLVSRSSFGSYWSICNEAGKESISVSGSRGSVQWKISKSHGTLESFTDTALSFSRENPISTSYLFTSTESTSTASGWFSVDVLNFMESMCSEFLLSKGESYGCASAWSVEEGGTCVDDFLSTGAALTPSNSFEHECVPEVVSLKLGSALEYQKLILRVKHVIGEKDRSNVFLRFVIFNSRTLTIKVMHFVFARLSKKLITQISLMPEIRGEKKKRRHLDPVPAAFQDLLSKCLVPLLAGNSKPYIVLKIGSGELSSAVEHFLDICEKIRFTALPCVVESLGGNGFVEFDVVERVEGLEKRGGVSSEKKVGAEKELEQELESELANLNIKLDIGVPNTSRSGGCGQFPSSPSNRGGIPLSLNLSLSDENELAELRSRNLELRHEIDRLKCGVNSSAGVNAYTAHMVMETKHMRAQLSELEADRRKYETTKRLLDALMDKTNKQRTEMQYQLDKLQAMYGNEKLLREELARLRDHCEMLLERNRQLELGFREEVSSRRGETKKQPAVIVKPPVVDKVVKETESPKRPHEKKIIVDHSPVAPIHLERQSSNRSQLTSVYKQFLFPFRNREDLQRHFAKLQKLVGSGTAVDAEKAGKSLEVLRDLISQLVSASEKLEVSAYCMIKQLEEKSMGEDLI